MRRNSRRAKGFTLVETLVAIGILAVAILMINFIATSLRDFRNAQSDTAATTFARTFIDSTRALWSQKGSACPASTPGGTAKACTLYPTAQLPTLAVPSGSGLKFSVDIRNSAGTVVASCALGTVCIPTNTSTDAAVLSDSQRTIKVKTSDASSRSVQLAMNVSRTDIP